MTSPLSAVYQYIVKELATSEHKSNETALTIVCEPLAGQEGGNSHGSITMHLAAGTTAEEARAIASTLQTKVKGLCHLQTVADGAA